MNICEWPSGCDNYKEGNTRFCGSHNHETRKAEREASKPKKIAHTIRKRSVREAERMKEYNKVRAEYLETHQHCEAKLIGCLGLATDIHHTKDRLGDNLTTHIISVCRRCHSQIHDKLSAQLRREKGLLI